MQDSSPFVSHLLLLGLASTTLAISTTAQCPLAWQPAPATQGPIGSVSTISTLPNGDLIAAGAFEIAGSAIAQNVARYNGTAWQALGAGVTGSATNSVVMPNGDIIVAGELTSAGGIAVNNIARWDGSNWFELGQGLSDEVIDLFVLPNGDLVAGGHFEFAGNVLVNGIAIWDGSTWTALGAGPSTAAVISMTVTTSGDIIAGANNPQGTDSIFRWNGSTWQPLPGLPASQVWSPQDLLAMPNGDLVIRGTVITPAGSSVLGIWDGLQLTALQPAVSFAGGPMAVASNGDLLVGRWNPLIPAALAARYDGTNWTEVGNTVSTSMVTRTLDVDANGKLRAGRAPLGGATSVLSAVAELNAGQWQAVGNSATAVIRDVQAMNNGDVVIAGEFTQFDGTAANNIAVWNGTTWAPLGLGVDDVVSTLGLSPDGSLIVGGSFMNAGGAPAQHVARWDGFSWSTLGAGVIETPVDIVANGNGEVLVTHVPGAGIMNYFDGQNWTGVSAPSLVTRDAIAMPNGDFLISGQYLDLNVFPLLWSGAQRLVNGAFVSEPGSEDFQGDALAVGPGGEVIVATRQTTGLQATQLQQLVNGQALPYASASIGGEVRAMEFLPNGDLVIVGPFTTINLQPIAGAARWDGAAWSEIAGGVQIGVSSSLAASNRGELFLGGLVGAVNGQAVGGLAWAKTPCPASVQSFGAGCLGSAGPVSLTPDSLPWTGSTMTSTATGMTSTSLAVHAVGITSIAAPLPLGAPGCVLLTDPVLVTLLLPSNGQVQAEFAVPSSNVLVGQLVLTQVIGIELGANLSLQQTTSSNALQLLIGSF